MRTFVGLNQFNTLNDLVDEEMKSGIKTFIFDLAELKFHQQFRSGHSHKLFKKNKEFTGFIENN